MKTFYIYVVFSFPLMSYDVYFNIAFISQGHRTIVRDLLHKEQLSNLEAVLSFCPSNLTSVMSASYTTYQLSNLRAFIPGSCPCQSRQHRSCCPQWRMGTQVGMCRQKQQEHQPKSKIHVTYGGDICRTKCRSLLQNC